MPAKPKPAAPRTQIPVAIVGGIRIPFCRNNTAYADVGNFGLGLKAVAGLVERYGLHGERLGELAFGAVIKHSSDWNLAREIALSSGLDPRTPGLTLQRACGTSLDAAVIVGNKIAAGQIGAGIAGGSDTTSDVPVVFGRRFARRLLETARARGLRERLRAWKGFRPGELKPSFPGVGEPRTGMSMGEHTERMARAWGIGRAEQDALALASHQKAAAAWERGFHADLIVPFRGVRRDTILRPDTTLEKLAQLKPAFDRSSGQGTLTAGNSTPLTDGASAALLASPDWVRERDLPVRAWLRDARVAAVDFVHGEGLLMAPTLAVAELLAANDLTLQDFDYYEIHEAFAAQVLCTLRAWESAEYCRDKLGLAAPLGSIDMDRLNPVGSSLALGHPFAATGTRILATAAKLLEERGGGRVLISVCTAGGMGVAAIVER
ncbi:MAG: acetyl-CoA C-acetyltransferase [Xanthomonadales bacterium]|nr:acetyl-CoA C-acetyltransferase [Xanthomonadales bacterium]